MKEITMDNWTALDKRYQTIAWGVGLVWIGILSIIPGEQNEIGILSIGVILLSLNTWRYLSNIPINVFTTILGIVMSALGLAVILRPVLNFPRFELDLFSLLLIVIGLYILLPGQKCIENG
jgi:hypothetical protein